MNGRGAPTMGFGVRQPGSNLNLPFSSYDLDKCPNSSVSHFPYLLNFHSTYTHPLHETIKKMTKKNKGKKIGIILCHVKDIATAQQMLPPLASDDFPGPDSMDEHPEGSLHSMLF